MTTSIMDANSVNPITGTNGTKLGYVTISNEPNGCAVWLSSPKGTMMYGFHHRDEMGSYKTARAKAKLEALAILQHFQPDMTLEDLQA